MIISRRNILLGSASLPLTLSLSPNFINQDNDKNKNILILLHAKGGMDGLQLIAPSNDKYYRRARKNFGLFPYGSEKGLNLKTPNLLYKEEYLQLNFLLLALQKQ